MDLDLLLIGLRQVHVPETVSFWPLAPIWWILLLLLIASIVLSVLKKRPKKNPYPAIGLAQLNRIRKASRQHRSSATTCAELSRLVRRLALAHYPRAQVAPLTGEAWLAFLDQTGRTQAFTQGVGRWLISAPYKAQPEVNLRQSFKLIRRWIKQLEHSVPHD